MKLNWFLYPLSFKGLSFKSFLYSPKKKKKNFTFVLCSGQYSIALSKNGDSWSQIWQQLVKNQNLPEVNGDFAQLNLGSEKNSGKGSKPFSIQRSVEVIHSRSGWFLKRRRYWKMGAEGLLKLFMLSSTLAMHPVGLNNDFSDDLYVYLIIQFPVLVKSLQAE